MLLNMENQRKVSNVTNVVTLIVHVQPSSSNTVIEVTEAKSNNKLEIWQLMVVVSEILHESWKLAQPQWLNN